MKFIHNAITLFYKISNNLVTISLPHYIAKARPEAMRYTRQNANTIHRLDTTTYCCQFFQVVMRLSIAFSIVQCYYGMLCQLL